MATMQSLLDALKAKRGKAYYEEFVAFMQQVTDDYNGVADRFIATSSSTVTVGSGTKAFTLSATGKSIAVGSYMMAYKTSDPTVYMVGQVTAISDPSLTISVDAGDYAGSGSVSAWTIILSAKPASLSSGTVTPVGGYGAASLATLTGASQTMARQCVLMVRTVDGGNDPNVSPATWKVLKPDGTLLDTTGTTTMGLQEAINYAIPNGYSLIVEGGGVKGTAPSGVDPSIIHCTTAITFPPMQKGYVSIRGATINFDGSPVGSPYAINFDSMMMTRVEFPGSQIVAYASAYAGCVNINPVNNLPLDPVAVITDSVIDLCTTVAYPGKTCVQLYAGVHGIASNDIRIMEPNGGAVGVQVVAGTGAGAFYDNRVKIIDAHLQTSTCVAVGNGTTGAPNIFANKWGIGCDPATGATGVSIYGTCDEYNISVRNEEGTPAVGIALQSSADQNKISATLIEANAKVTDGSTTKSNRLSLPRDIAICNRGNVDQSGIATATWTTVQFTAAPRNTLGSFDTSTYRFTASVPGFYKIDAQASFTSISDQTPIGIGTWLTGTQSKQMFATASGTDSNVSVGISQIAYLDTGAYVEIKVIQSSGGTLTLSGDNKRTAAYFERID